jgi:4,5-dihydroxyphthalate decarboxylase
VPGDRTLSDMLAKGEIDGMMTARVPSVFLAGAPHVGRLFPDYPAAEEAYFGRTKIFPIMHLIGIRRSLVERHPWLPVSVYKAFAKAKEMAIDELGIIGHLAATLPWPVAAQERARRILGDDYWSYGNTETNRHVLGAFMRYSHEQGLIAKPMDWEQLFAPSTLELSKI